MAKIRDPVRDEAYILWKEAGGNKAPKGILKEIAEKLNVPEGTLRGWKAKDKWNVPMEKKIKRSQKETERSDKKKRITEAKTMVINGSTIKEASEKTGVSERVLQKYSAKENWMTLQQKCMQERFTYLQSKYGEEYMKHTEETLEMLKWIRNSSFAKLVKEQLDKDDVSVINSVANVVMKTIKGEAELIGVTDIKSLIGINFTEQDLEIKKQKIRDPKGKDKTGTFLDKLEEFI